MTAELSYMTLRSANQAREAEEQRMDQRRKNVLILVYDYLKNTGYAGTALSFSPILYFHREFLYNYFNS